MTSTISPIDTKTIAEIPPDMVSRFWPDLNTSSTPLVRMGVAGEGTCFFHSVCAGTNYKDYLNHDVTRQQQIGQTFRCDMTNLIDISDWNNFIKSRNLDQQVPHVALDYNELKRQFCDISHWADEPIIRWTCKTLKRNVLFIDALTNDVYCGVNGKPQDPMLLIMWINHSHFEPVGLMHHINRTSDMASLQFEFIPGKDDHIIQPIVSHYNTQCKSSIRDDY